ncbi:MAG: cryptochrome/photolyase family protein [Patescibacteria group bacterium]
MKSICLILGDQLFEQHPAFEICDEYCIIESMDFNESFRYHKNRLLHCFVAMREYKDLLQTLNKSVKYYTIDHGFTIQKLCIELKKEGYTKILVSFVEDKNFLGSIQNITKEVGITLEILSDNKFLTTKSDWDEYRLRNSKRFFMNDFYIYQRKRLKIFVDDNLNSTFPKWSLDEENRKKIPKSHQIPFRKKIYKSEHLDEVKELINRYFKDNFGEIGELYFPVNHAQARDQVDEFFEKYFDNFGDYEDAMTTKDPFVYHSLFSTSLNNGLITPKHLLEKITKSLAPDNSKEGLVRQIIGWREWVRCLYWFKYDSDLTKYNFFNHTKKLPDYFWNRSRLVEIRTNVPLYETLNKVFEFGYCHHIERLMILGNWMVLNEYDPYECYVWFMTAFIDSYSWVMVANVFGMGLYSDGGIFATKPYISGGNYIKKMSDYDDYKIWEPIWTDLFWAFLFKHESFFSTNPRLSMLLKSKKNKP